MTEIKKIFSNKNEIRPKLIIELTVLDRFLNLAGWFFLTLLWGTAFYLYHSLPEIIPTHFNIKGEVDSYGCKSILFILPAIVSIVFFVSIILTRFPHSFNYPVKITEENASRQYALANKLIRIMNIDITIVFLIVLIFMSNYPAGENSKFSVLLLPLIIAFTTVPVLVYLIRASKEK